MEQNNSNPLTISIITVVYNGANLIRGTVNSVLAQTYPHIEYIIVDGGSKDGTVDIVHSYGDRIQHFISEPDKGLYDAMNKGLALATGDYVWFMNCGDHISTPGTVARMFSQKQDADIYYGDVMMVDDERRPLGLRSEVTPHRLPTRLDWRSLRRGMVVSHQAFIPKRDIAPLYMEGNLCADIEWVIECLKKSNNTHHTQLTLATFLTGGVSRARHKQSLRDRYLILRRQYGLLPNLFNHSIIVLRGLLHRLRRRGKASY